MLSSIPNGEHLRGRSAAGSLNIGQEEGSVKRGCWKRARKGGDRRREDRSRPTRLKAARTGWAARALETGMRRRPDLSHLLIFR